MKIPKVILVFFSRTERKGSCMQTPFDWFTLLTRKCLNSKWNWQMHEIRKVFWTSNILLCQLTDGLANWRKTDRKEWSRGHAIRLSFAVNVCLPLPELPLSSYIVNYVMLLWATCAWGDRVNFCFLELELCCVCCKMKISSVWVKFVLN